MNKVSYTLTRLSPKAWDAKASTTKTRISWVGILSVSISSEFGMKTRFTVSNELWE